MDNQRAKICRSPVNRRIKRVNRLPRLKFYNNFIGITKKRFKYFSFIIFFMEDLLKILTGKKLSEKKIEKAKKGKRIDNVIDYIVTEETEHYRVEPAFGYYPDNAIHSRMKKVGDIPKNINNFYLESG